MSEAPAIPANPFTEIHDPYCPRCGAAICEHPERNRNPNADIPEAVRRALYQCAVDKQISIYWLCGVYRQGVKDAETLQRPQDEWQPIETAPKDGRWLLGWHEDYEWFVFRDGPGFITGEDPMPTHWQPLPAPPALEGRRAAQQTEEDPASRQERT